MTIGLFLKIALENVLWQICALWGLFLCFQLADSCGVQEPFEGSFSHPWLSSGRLDVPRGSFQPSSSHELTGRLQPSTLQLQSRELHPAHPTQTLRRCPHLTNTLHPIRPNFYQLATEIISVTIQYGMKPHRGVQKPWNAQIGLPVPCKLLIGSRNRPSLSFYAHRFIEHSSNNNMHISQGVPES